MRELGLSETSAGAIRIVKRRAQELRLDWSHFTGQRRWSDALLRRAVANSASWDELLAALGLGPDHGDGRTVVKAHARRLGLDLAKLQCPDHPVVPPDSFIPDKSRLRTAGAAIAASWFLLCGCGVSFPVEPAVFDVLAETSDGIKRVQVKTTTCRVATGWMVSVGRRPYSAGNRGPLVPYDPDVIDYFFVVDGDLSIYLIPSAAIAGRVQIMLRTYAQFIVGSLWSLWPDAAPAA
jgi:hypothetical protein